MAPSDAIPLVISCQFRPRAVRRQARGGASRLGGALRNPGPRLGRLGWRRVRRSLSGEASDLRDQRRSEPVADFAQALKLGGDRRELSGSFGAQ